jgi:hypothetical protein
MLKNTPPPLMEGEKYQPMSFRGKYGWKKKEK